MPSIKCYLTYMCIIYVGTLHKCTFYFGLMSKNYPPQQQNNSSQKPCIWQLYSQEVNTTLSIHVCFGGRIMTADVKKIDDYFGKIARQRQNFVSIPQ